ncbi:MAG: COX15/CtaA family protein [Candidatus Eremiobacteraeota bacterium]|nr:COX15/CtaA family protein [Candidatus Eremiobacteraeota bacterium]
MKNFARLCAAAAVVAFGAAVMGSWTRINGAGMSCPDWPTCLGVWVPSLAGGTLWEWSHRLLVLCEAPLVAAVVAAGWRMRFPARLPLLGLVAALFGAQVFLGAATVHESNSPMSVVLHWGTAMAFIATLTVVAILAYEAGAASDERRGSRLVLAALSVTALLAFATMCVGAYVSSSGAGLACLSIPGCAGQVIVYGSGQFVQMLHRTIAGATLLSGAAALAVTLVRGSVRVRWACGLGASLLFGQIVLGLLNVSLHLPMLLREAHAANAAATFLAFVAATALTATERFPMRATAL